MVHPALSSLQTTCGGFDFPCSESRFLEKSAAKVKYIVLTRLDAKTAVSTKILSHRQAPRRS
jgi:hypothetical protein